MTSSARLVAFSLLALSASVPTAACGNDGAIPLPEFDGSTGVGVDSGGDSGDDASESGDAADAAMAADADAGTRADGDAAATPPGDGGGDSSTGGDAGGDAAQPMACDGGAPVTHDVTVGSGFMFAPSALTICAGDTVRWTWATGGHTVTSGANCTPDNQFCSPNDTNCAAGATSAANAVYTHTFPTPGTYPYFCVPHCMAGMTGTITVQ